ncbi:ABC transporter ATP-binding protein [Streptomyces sp. ISL-12]|uniref:ABC transporter ATP-binding protein n=1 Tax=Streptomyces sp. ISL-12 TaxID=2819177 RepID=UPI0027DF8411|nr:ABC transporter ATP-binding protein [Streptomyces sp. ISL-12]
MSKRYRRGRPVLVDVDFRTSPGAVQAVTGGNGSGKSTLLRILAGVSRPTSGTRSGDPGVIGYVPDRFPAGTRLSARSYLAHMGRVKGLPSRRAVARGTELLSRFDLVGGFETPIRDLSKGNAQKVAVAQALLVPPRLLILDEPWSGLDASTHGVLASVITEVASGGGTVVFTDHREAVTRSVATEVYRIEAGRLGEASAVAPDTADPRASVSEVVLRAPGPWPAALVDALTRAEGVRSVTPEGEHGVRVRVPRGHCDTLLLTALHAGWSVDALRHDVVVPAPADGRVTR